MATRPTAFTPVFIPPSPKFGNRLSLRSPVLSDAPSLLARARNPSCVAHIPGLRYSQPTLASYESLIRTWQDQSTQLQSRFLIIVLASTGESIGDAGFESLHRAIQGYGDKIAPAPPLSSTSSSTDDGKSSSSSVMPLHVGEAGIMLDDTPAVRGQGYAIEALRMVFEYGFAVLGLAEIHVRTMHANAAMRGVMERCFGFGDVAHLSYSAIAADSPGTGGDVESVADAPLGRVERFWKLMSDRVEQGERESAVCYCLERAKWKP